MRWRMEKRSLNGVVKGEENPVGGVDYYRALSVSSFLQKHFALSQKMKNVTANGFGPQAGGQGRCEPPPPPQKPQRNQAMMMDAGGYDGENVGGHFVPVDGGEISVPSNEVADENQSVHAEVAGVSSGQVRGMLQEWCRVSNMDMESDRCLSFFPELFDGSVGPINYAGALMAQLSTIPGGPILGGIAGEAADGREITPVPDFQPVQDQSGKILAAENSPKPVCADLGWVQERPKIAIKETDGLALGKELFQGFKGEGTDTSASSLHPVEGFMPGRSDDTRLGSADGTVNKKDGRGKPKGLKNQKKPIAVEENQVMARELGKSGLPEGCKKKPLLMIPDEVTNCSNKEEDFTAIRDVF